MRAPVSNSTELADIQAVFSVIEAGDGRSASTQALYQFAALCVTFVVAIVFGGITGTQTIYVYAVVGRNACK